MGVRREARYCLLYTSINPATAAEHGIAQDDWVWIETYVDKIRQRANLTEAIKPGMIHVEHDWWFPEREATDVYKRQGRASPSSGPTSC